MHSAIGVKTRPSEDSHLQAVVCTVQKMRDELGVCEEQCLVLVADAELADHHRVAVRLLPRAVPVSSSR